MTKAWEVLVGDCREQLATLPEASVHTCVTSPPYFGLRDYGTGTWAGGDPECAHTPRHRAADAVPWDGTLDGAGDRPRPLGAPHRGGDPWRCQCGAERVDAQIGLEPSPDEFAEALVAVFREVRRVLRDDGTVWLNLGDSYCGSPQGTNGNGTSNLSNPDRQRRLASESAQHRPNRRMRDWPDVKPKDLIGIPWLVAFALRADGWFLRSEIIWSKLNPMPESVTDRPTRAHEQIFLLSKCPRYFYDAEAVREPLAHPDGPWGGRTPRPGIDVAGGGQASTEGFRGYLENGGRNKRDVWTVTTKPFAGAHFATFPRDLIEPCVLAGAPERACSACGMPWRRIIEGGESTWDERKAAGATWGNMENAASGGGTQRVVHGEGVSRDLTPTPSRTVGHEPACECGAAAAPGVVLDPFTGAGTSGVVALQHGRRFVGVELNAEYAEMARDRIAVEGRPGYRRQPSPPPQADGQLGLLDVAP